MNFLENETKQKLRGGYYTPDDLARFLLGWVAATKPQTILEPSCGDGVFLGKYPGLALRSQFTAFELDPAEAEKARQRASAAKSKAQVHARDFLRWAIDQLDSDGTRFDAVVGNPPFIRYQYLPSAFQEHAELVFKRLSVPFTKHTNAWVPFILASIALLKPGGRLGMVVPAEIIHVLHAQGLRSYLGNQCRRIVVVDPETLWFEGTLQGAVLLLAEKARTKAEKREGLGIYSVRNREFLDLAPTEVFNAPRAINGKTVEGKWTRALLDKSTLSLLDQLEDHADVHRFSDIADVDVGIVTGANKFFLVHDDVVKRHSLESWAHPMFGRSEHCPGVIYDDRQHRANAKAGNPTNFIWFPQEVSSKHRGALEYIEHGESQALPTRYKCRIRKPWYSVPSVYATEIGMLKRAHDTPRLILNKLGAYTTDTAYRIRVRKGEAEALVCCFLNPLTALSAELEGRHYGGGVLELVPSEIEKLLVPFPDVPVTIKALDDAVRRSPTQDVLKANGERVLGALGLSKSDQNVLMEGWNSLRARRQRTGEDEASANQSQ